MYKKYISGKNAQKSVCDNKTRGQARPAGSNSGAISPEERAKARHCREADNRCGEGR